MNEVSGINYYITDFCKLKCNASQCLSFPGVKIIDLMYLRVPYFELLLTVRYQINQDFLSVD